MTFSIEHAAFAYPRSAPILRDVNVTVAPGELLAILGPNGVGKTTLLRAMIGLQPWTSGASYLDGVDIATMKAATLWKQVAYVPQARSAASVSLTGLDMVIIGRSAHLRALAQPGQAERAMAEAAMADIGIAHLRDVPCAHMSGGQLQMVLIARALVTEPSVIVLDEPETGLDFRNQLIVLDLLDDLVHTRGITAIMNTHYPAHALRVADRSLLLSAAGTPIVGDTASIVTEDNLRAVFDVFVHLAEVSRDGRLHTSVLPVSVAQPLNSGDAQGDLEHVAR